MVNVLQPATEMFDVIVVGGGPAGLSAALMLGRCRRSVLVCDLGRPRNRHSAALHGYLTRDGTPPAEFNAIGREELVRYGVQFRPVAVAGAALDAGSFRVSLADGGEERSRFLLLATGVDDEVPPVAEMAACYGRSIFHCPYCDGWEWRDRRLAVYGKGASGVTLALSMKTWSPHVILCTDGLRLDGRSRGRLERNGIAVRTEKIAAVEHQDGMVSAIRYREGAPDPVEAIFFTAGQHQQSALATGLGCVCNDKGTVDTGRLSQTNVPGVFVAGDASRDAQFVVVAAAEGTKAALAINQALQRQELRP